MSTRTNLLMTALVAIGVSAASAASAANAIAQPGPMAVSNEGGAGGEASRSLADAAEKYVVVIDLDDNQLHFRQGNTTLWSAPVGTGTGLRLQSDRGEWEFSTPNGEFQVQYKELEPDWIAPDWYFIENELPIPPRNDAKRRFPGGLGAAAVYIGRDLAIHGTDKPELLGQRVSHGCIRLSDRDAKRLFHNVQIGTKVVIVGGEDLPEPKAFEPDESTFTPDGPKKKPVDPVLERWKRQNTADLFAELDLELWADARDSRWTEVAGMLLDRGLEDGDVRALRGLMERIGDLPSRDLEREYATFLADAYARGTRHTLAALGDMEPLARTRAARAIVAATAGLYGGALDDQSTPWPTQRIPQSALRGDERRGWESLATAERLLGESGTRRFTTTI